MKRLFFILFLLVLLVLSFFYKNLTQKHHVEVNVRVEKGLSTKEVLRFLEKKGILNSFYSSYIYLRLKGSNLKSGCYRFSGSYSDIDVIKIVAKGSSCPVSVAIPEGANVFKVALILDNAHLCRKEEFLKLAFDRDFIKSLGLNGFSLEGFLFPDTYLFDEGSTCERVVLEIVENFKRKVLPLFSSYKTDGYVRKALGKVDMVKVLTVASIIERETSVKDEKPLVASVIYNRLIRGMPLQCDPTVYYAYYLERRSKFSLHEGDTSISSPYNTYVNKGLPPGPICNPGLDSILAAMYPAKTKFLYFVVRPDRRGHFFSKSYNEHLKFVKETFRIGEKKKEKVRN